MTSSNRTTDESTLVVTPRLRTLLRSSTRMHDMRGHRQTTLRFSVRHNKLHSTWPSHSHSESCCDDVQPLATSPNSNYIFCALCLELQYFSSTKFSTQSEIAQPGKGVTRDLSQLRLTCTTLRTVAISITFRPRKGTGVCFSRRPRPNAITLLSYEHYRYVLGSYYR